MTLTAFTFALSKDGHAAEFTFYSGTLAGARKLAEKWAAERGWSLVEGGEAEGVR